MARRTFYATRDLKNPGYGTRMLRAGDPVELDAPKARLYLALGAVSATKPKGIAATPVARIAENEKVEIATPKPARKPATKKTTRRKK